MGDSQFSLSTCLLIVIASEQKQSHARKQVGFGDCFVALLLAMTLSWHSAIHSLGRVIGCLLGFNEASDLTFPLLVGEGQGEVYYLQPRYLFIDLFLQ